MERSVQVRLTATTTQFSFLFPGSESEDFEALAIVRVEGLLKDAHAHKKNLESQKQALIARLRRVTNILEKSDGKHSHDNS